MVNIDNSPVKHKKQLQDNEPAKWAIVLHARPNYSLRAMAAISHALRRHLSLNSIETASVLAESGVRGKAVCRTVTKDVGETLIADVYSCSSTSDSKDFSFKLEQV